MKANWQSENNSSKFELVKKTNTRMLVNQSLCDIVHYILRCLCKARKNLTFKEILNNVDGTL